MAFPYTPKIRYQVLDGNPAVIDLSGVRFITIARQNFDPVFEEHEMLDRSMEPVKFGWRQKVRLEFTVLNGSADDALLATVHPYLNDPDTEIDVTLDGVRYDDCYLSKWSREYVGEKNVAAHYMIELTIKRLINAAEAVGPVPVRPSAPGTMGTW